jgi:predicted Fe-S protein YdhL (DUF1289 family)
MDEIAGWPDLDEAARARILARLRDWRRDQEKVPDLR